MRCARLWLIGLGVLAVVAASPPAPARGPAAKPSAALTAEQLADRIDELIEAKWRDKDVRPAPLTDDAEFLRRLSLDASGRIPSVQDVRLFLGDKSPDKRRKLVNKLLESPLYSTHFAAVWRAHMVPDSNSPFAQGSGPLLEAWLKARLRENARYDKMVREVITTPVVAGRAMPGRAGQEPTPLPFYQAQEMKPENLAAATSRLFLGVKLECAQCHNHPFAKWKREQFWEYAAFFSGIQSPPNQPGVAVNDVADRRDIRISGTDKVVEARFLDRSEPQWKENVGTRQTLADWVTSPQNPFFARAAANRLWAHFFGVGIVEPVDEESEDNPPSHPELLDELARQFVLHDFDMKYLIRAITYSKAYQRSSGWDSADGPEPRLFARMSIKGLTAEQLYDSIVEATRYKELGRVANPRGAVFQAGDAREEFVGRFSNHSDKRTEFQTSILQALALMNGKFVADATSLQNSVTLAGVIDTPWMKTTDKIESLYLSALSRKPRPEELERLVKYVERGGPSGNKDKALADVFWVLLNSSEFILNH